MVCISQGKKTTQTPEWAFPLHYIYYIVKSTLPFIYIYTLYSCNFLFKQESAHDIFKSSIQQINTAYKMSHVGGSIRL